MKYLVMLSFLLTMCTKNIHEESGPITSNDRTTFTISGNVLWEHNDVSGVNGVIVTLSGVENQTTTTNTDGYYQFTVSTIGNYTIAPTKGIGAFTFNGVNSADATAIQQHLTGSNMITDFYKIVASDCNKSNNVSSVDAALIRQGLIGNSTALTILNNTGSWRFAAGDYVPAIPPAPYTIPVFPTTRSINLSADAFGIDFIGIKVGDVNGTTNPGL